MFISPNTTYFPLSSKNETQDTSIGCFLSHTQAEKVTHALSQTTQHPVPLSVVLSE